MNVLQIVSSAYRCTVEEQDDPVIWIANAMRAAGADLGVLLRGNAVHYATSGQERIGVTIGTKTQGHPADLPRETERLLEEGVPVFVVAEDADVRGIQPGMLLPGTETVSRGSLPSLFGRYDQVWHW